MTMAKKSAGILLYRLRNEKLEVLLVHPGGPFWSKKDLGTWSIPKGEFEDNEDPFEAAKREFKEELGTAVSGDHFTMTPVKQKNNKTVYAFAINGDLDASVIKSNTFKMEWPPKSGKEMEFPEVDKAGWFDYETAKLKMNTAQISILEELISISTSKEL
jgi:predicted NUDIX family NTP pyrophosphohydrolase